jgi:hypothetical protein
MERRRVVDEPLVCRADLKRKAAVPTSDVSVNPSPLLFDLTPSWESCGCRRRSALFTGPRVFVGDEEQEAGG